MYTTPSHLSMFVRKCGGAGWKAYRGISAFLVDAWRHAAHRVKSTHLGSVVRTRCVDKDEKQAVKTKDSHNFTFIISFSFLV